MPEFYTEMAAMARNLLAPTSAGGLGQGEIVLVHKTPGAPNPNAPWEPVQPALQNEPLRGAVRGVSKELVGVEMGGTVILASDRQAITEVPSISYKPSDSLTIDGVPVQVIGFERIPAAGIASAVRFTIRG